MPTIEYCDNIHCRLNKNRSCSSDDVEFDENGICVTASYDETPTRKGPHSSRQGDSGSDPVEQNEIAEQDIPPIDKDKNWVKYI